MRKKVAYLLLMALLVCQLQVPTFAVTFNSLVSVANLEVSLKLDYPIATTPDGKSFKLELLKENSEKIGELTLKGNTIQETTLNVGQPCIVEVQPLNEEGNLVEANERVYTYHVVFQGLPLGDYKIALQAEGYTTYTSEAISLNTHEKHVVVSTAGKSFTAGDLDNNGVVDLADRTLLESVLGKESFSPEQDINGDKKVDIEDLAQLHWNINATGSAKVYTTKIIMSKMADITAINEELKSNGISVEGNLQTLFDKSEGTQVVFSNGSPITETNPLALPVALKEELKVSQIEITTDNIKTGIISYVDETGKEQAIHFDADQQAAIRSIYTTGRKNKIVINLGKQVPIQKITVQVTGTEKGDHLAAISKIEFLEDVVDLAVNQETGAIKGLKVQEKDKEIQLTWNKVPNVTGYKVRIGANSKEYTDNLYVETERANIKMLNSEELENFIPYYFTVQAVNGEWEGPLSEEIVATPKPLSKPPAPTNVVVTERDESLELSWGGSEVATGWNAYYKKKEDKAYTKIENLIEPQTVIYSLENGVSYQLYVTAYNEKGESGASEIVEAIPKREEIIIPKIPTHNRIDNKAITDIQLVDKNNVDMKFYPKGFDTKNMIDNDFYTHWTALTYQKTRGVTITFDKPYEMDYLAFVPRLDKDLDRKNQWYKGHPYLYEIKIWEEETSTPKTIVQKTTIPASGVDGLRILPFPKSQVKKIEVLLYEWNGAGNISIAELMCYEYDNLIESINNLFKDGTYTALKSGVTLEQIEALEARLAATDGYLQVPREVLIDELQLAKDLVSDGTSALMGETLIVTQGRNASTDRDRQFANGRGVSELQPTGVMANAGEQIIVYVDAEEGKPLPELIFTQYFGRDTWKANPVPLKKGRNVIVVPKIVNYNGDKGGSVYVKYTGEPQQEIGMHIRAATRIPTIEALDLSKADIKAEIKDYILELTTYVSGLDSKKKLELYPANSTEIGTEKVLLSLPASGVLKGIQGLGMDIDTQVDGFYETLMTWEATMELHYAVHGLSKDATESMHRWPTTRMNIRYMPMSEKAFMYAAADHAGIRWGSEIEMVKGSRTNENGYFGWGINHEIGHILNLNEYIYGETTNNIFSLFAQTVNQGKSRLESSNIYDPIYQKIVSENPGLSSNVFVTLGMFWQLHLAYDYDDVLGAGAQEGVGLFYPKLNQLFREDTTKDANVDKDNMLVRLTSDVVKKDLVPFFEAWDFNITPETKTYTSKYTKEDKPIYYLNDEARRYKLAGKTGMGTTSLTAQAEVAKNGDTGEDVVKLSITHDANPEDMLGYEIYRGDTLIAFTTDKAYEDRITANNISSTYSVVGIDKLLNKTDKVETNQVYIGADGTLDKSKYTITKEQDGSFLIELNDEQELVGIKLSNVTTKSALSIDNRGNKATTSSSYKVEISRDANNPVNWTLAKEGQMQSGESTIYYFNKPETTSDDQRIWTYDAKYIRIEGVDVEGLTAEQIDLIEYPGDAVYLNEPEAIGILESDFNYKGGVIPAGSTVVVGTYRGHPVFNKILVTGQFIDKGCEEKPEALSYSLDYSEEEEMPQLLTTSLNTLNIQKEEERALNGHIFLFSELPEDKEVSKVNNGIWIYEAKDELPGAIRARMYRTDEAESIVGGRAVSDTGWINVPAKENLPTIKLD